MKYKISFILILTISWQTSIHTKLPPEFQAMLQQNVTKALNAAKIVLANKNTSSSQKKKLKEAVTALNTFQQTLENSSNQLIFAGLKKLNQS